MGNTNVTFGKTAQGEEVVNIGPKQYEIVLGDESTSAFLRENTKIQKIAEQHSKIVIDDRYSGIALESIKSTLQNITNEQIYSSKKISRPSIRQYKYKETTH